MRLLRAFLFLAFASSAVAQILGPIIYGGPPVSHWLYRRSLTVDHTLVVNADQTDFTVPVYISDATFKDVAHGGHVQKSNGADILFFSDLAGTTQVPSEIELYDNVNGKVWGFAKKTVLTGSDAVFYVFYGNAAPAARSTGPYDAGFASAWHLTDVTKDSVGSNTLTNYNTVTAVAGKFGNAGQFVAASKQSLYLSPPSGLPTGGSASTFEVWFKLASTGALRIMGGWGNGVIPLSGAREILYWNNSDNKINADWYNTAARAVVTQDTNWHQVVVNCDGTGLVNGHCRVFVAGVDATNDYSISSLRVIVSNVVHLGLADDQAPDSVQTSYWNGLLDEVRIHTVQRSADWIHTNYHALDSPATFCVVGAEVAL